MKNTYNIELTEKEIEEIEKAINNIGRFGNVEVIKNNGVIDIIKSERIRIRDGKSAYHRG